MRYATIDWRVFRDLSWWHWLATIPLLAAHLSEFAGALYIAILICAAVGGYFWYRLREIHPYPVQVRLGYLSLLLMGLLPGMQWVHWIQLMGTTAMVTVGYCPLLRMLRLAPFNRVDPLTPAMVWRVFFRDPCVGGLINWHAGTTVVPAAACCSLAARPSGQNCSLPDNNMTSRTHQHASAH